MIAESVAFLAGEGKRVIYDAEHFFDAWRSDPAYALACLRAAAAGGAERVVLCDTNGSSLPARGRRRDGRRARPRSAARCPSASTATTTSSAAWPTRSPPSLAGATQVQGTMNGIGERTGNANLVSIIANLQLKLGPRAARPPSSWRA